MRRSIYIGFDTRSAEAQGYAVTRFSIERFLTQPIRVRGLILSELVRRALYTRPIETRDGKLWDVISEAPMSTEFAISRFLVPHLAKSGWALFLDCDMLVRTNFVRLFDKIEATEFNQFAVLCVKHDHRPQESMKMDAQAQTIYPRKNWSSFMLFNCDHPSNRALTVEMVNALPGRDLHRFCWLKDEEIGELGAEWNYLVGYTKNVVEPKVVHFTSGLPTLPGYEDCEYAAEWRAELNRWAA